MNLERLLADANDALQNKFGTHITDKELKIYDTNQWKDFLELNNLQPDAHGVHIKETGTSYVCEESPELASVVLHEYFGHGLYHELANKRKDPYGQLGITNSKTADDEGFALWIEQQLTNKLGLTRSFKRRQQLLPKECNQLLDIFNYTEQQLTTPGAWSQAGLPYSFTPDEARTLINKFYNDNHHIELATIYGSQKPTSDLDLFVVGEQTRTFDNGWLDIYEVSTQEMPRLLHNYDISVISPLVHGQAIIGEHDRYRQQLETTPITQQAIKHNLKRSQEQERIRQITTHPRTKDIASDYARSYRQNARFMRKGAYLTGRV